MGAFTANPLGWFSVADSPAGYRSRLRVAGAWLAVLVLVSVPVLLELFRLGLAHDLHSHVLLVPLVAAYLLYVRRGSLVPTYQPAFGWGIATLLGAVVGAVAALAAGAHRLGDVDFLALQTAAMVAAVWAGAFFCLGKAWVRSALWPLALLVFFVPLPTAATLVLERASQLASAQVAALFFHLAGLPFLQHGTVFELPGISIEVAEECSGIRSSWVLLITGAVAGDLFLRTPWRRGVLLAAVVVIGVIRNAFRILVIALLCVEVGPEMIDSAIHHRGGPVFFVLSLVPLLALIYWLRLGERSSRRGLRAPEAPSLAILRK